MKGTGKLTGQLSEVTVVYLASPQRHLHPSLHVSRRSLSHSIANIITHDVNMLKNHGIEFKWHHFDICFSISACGFFKLFKNLSLVVPLNSFMHSN